MIKRLLTSRAGAMFGTAGLVLGARVCGTVLTMIYTFLMVGVAPAEEVGRAFTALSAGFLLSVVASGNVEVGSIRFLPLYFEKAQEARAAGFVLWCRRTVLTVSAVVLLPVLGGMVWALGLEAMAPFLLSFAAAPIMANARINSRHGTALGLVLQAALPRMLVRPVFMTAVLGAANLAGLALDATQIMVAFVIAAALETALQWRLIRPAMAFRRAQAPRFDEAREWVSMGLLLSPMMVINEYLRDIILLAAGLALASADVARLGISLSMIGILNFGLSALDMVFSPKISRAHAQGNAAQRARLLSLCGMGKLGALAVGLPLAWVLIPLILPLIGPEYEGIDAMFLVLAIIPATRALLGPTNMVLNITGHKQILFWCALAGVGGITGGTILGGGAAGLSGAILGAVTAMALYQAALFALCRRRTGIDTTALALFWERRRAGGQGGQN